MSSPFAITADDVRRAARRLDGIAVRTPLLEYAVLNEHAGRQVLVKFEGAQHTGAFKFRGAYNRLSQIPAADRAAGVVAWSSGNHAQGVADAARRLGMPATIVMPRDAPANKLARTRALGAEIVLYDRFTQSREPIAEDLARQRGATLVPSFDDPSIMAGQGTIGLEIVDQARQRAIAVGAVLVPCGGGGLTAGVATAVKDADDSIEVYAVEPAAFDDTVRSLVSGARETAPADAETICDALMAPRPGALTFPINRALLAGGLTVSDGEVLVAMRFAFEHLKLVMEPGAAVALAAALHGKVPAGRGAIAVVVSGANVDAQAYAQMLTATPARAT